MFVPGSIFAINHPFSWYAIVKEKATGKRWTYWINGSQLTRENVAKYVSDHFHAVEVVTVDRCTTMPTKPLQPIPPHHFQFGVIQQIVEESSSRNSIPLLNRVCIGRSIPRKIIDRRAVCA